MNILHLRPFFEPGGASNYIGTLSEGLSQRNHRIMFACQNGDYYKRKFRTSIIYENIPFSPSSIKNLIPSVIQIVSIIKKERIQIINSHHRFTSFVGKISSLLTSVPLVSTMLEIKFDRSWMTALGLGNYIIAISQAIKDHIILQYQISPERIKVIRKGIPPSSPLTIYQKNLLRQELGLNPACFLIGCVGRLSSEKGQKYLLEAAPDVLLCHPYSQFVFIGDGTEKQNLEKLVESLGLGRSVKFLGWRDDVDDVIDIMDLIVIPSISEGLGIAALEALSHKKAVIASQTGGLPEIIQSEKTGLLVPPGNPFALREAIIQLLKDSDLRVKLGENGYQTIKADYSVSRMIDETERLYKIAIGNHSIS